MIVITFLFIQNPLLHYIVGVKFPVKNFKFRGDFYYEWKRYDEVYFGESRI